MRRWVLASSYFFFAFCGEMIEGPKAQSNQFIAAFILMDNAENIFQEFPGSCVLVIRLFRDVKWLNVNTYIPS
jgi:hypothetical protein